MKRIWLFCVIPSLLVGYVVTFIAMAEDYYHDFMPLVLKPIFSIVLTTLLMVVVLLTLIVANEGAPTG